MLLWGSGPLFFSKTPDPERVLFVPLFPIPSPLILPASAPALTSLSIAHATPLTHICVRATSSRRDQEEEVLALVNPPVKPVIAAIPMEE